MKKSTLLRATCVSNRIFVTPPPRAVRMRQNERSIRNILNCEGFTPFSWQPDPFLDAVRITIHTGWYVNSEQESETQSDSAARS